MPKPIPMFYSANSKIPQMDEGDMMMDKPIRIRPANLKDAPKSKKKCKKKGKK